MSSQGLSSSPDRYGFLVTGPNASGKTTTLREVEAIYAGDERLVVLYFDHRHGDAFKTTNRAVKNLTDVWLSPVQVLIVEGVRAQHPTRIVTELHPTVRQLRAFVTRSTPAAMEAMLRRRCEKRGKRFRDDYWKERQLDYECRRRYLNVPQFAERVTWVDVDETYAGTVALREALTSALREILGDPIITQPPAEQVSLW